MKEIKIEKGIPIPPRRRTTNAWESIEVGDSFVSENRSSFGALVAWASRNNNGREFVSRKIEGGKIRVWRVK